MSVINDMLRDLDKRQAPEVGGSRTIPQESLIGPQSSVYPKIILLLIGLLLLVLGYFLVLNKQSSKVIETEVLSSQETHQLVHNDNLLVKSELTEPKEQTQQISESIAVQEKPDDSQTQAFKESLLQDQVVEKPNKSAPEAHPLSSLPKSEVKLTEVTAKTSPQERQKLEIAEPVNTKPLNNHERSQTKVGVSSESVTLQKKSNVDSKVSGEYPVVSSEIEEAKPELLKKVANTSGVKLSPVALDQQMAERAVSLISQHKEVQAYRELYAFIGEHEEDMESRTVLATYLLQENRLAEVGDVLLNAPLNKSPKLRQLKARWYAQQGEHKLALYTLNSDLPEVALYPDYYVLLAAYYQRYGSAQEAKNTYSVLVQHDETIADWWAGLGLASDRNNEKEKASYAYRQALELKGLSPELLNFVQTRLAQLQVAQ